MIDIGRVLIDLLLDKGKATVPGLGQFSLVYTPAEVYKYTKRVVPPKYKIDFKGKDSGTHDILFDTLMRVYNIPAEEADNAIANWVKGLTETINAGKLFEIEDIGSFIKDNEKIIFTQDEKSVLLYDNLGLEPVKIPLIELDEEDKEKKREALKKVMAMPKFVKVGIWAAIGIIIICFSLATLYQNGLLDTSVKYVTSLFTLNKNEVVQLATNDTLNTKIDANELKRAALKYNESFAPKRLRKVAGVKPQSKKLTYYIVAGSYKTLKNAKRFENKMKLNGFEAQTMAVEDALYRVALFSASNRQKVVEEYVAITNKDPNLKIWIFTRAE